MTDLTIPTDREHLAQYATTELRGEAVYRGYRPRAAFLERAAELLPRAHVVVVSGSWCPDCRREVPKLARIFQHLPPAWTVEVLGDDAATRSAYDVRAIPTFLVLDAPNGRELGRIIESPTSSDGIEGDLLAIAENAVRATGGATHVHPTRGRAAWTARLARDSPAQCTLTHEQCSGRDCDAGIVLRAPE